MWSQGPGNNLYIVRLKPGTKILDLSDEAHRTVLFGTNDPPILKFMKRPAITDDVINWFKPKVSEEYKRRNPDWERKVEQYFDPDHSEFDIEDAWRPYLIRYARDKGYGGIRFADEILLTDRSYILDVRPAKKKEKEEVAASKPTWPTRGLFTNVPTGAAEEYHRWHIEKALAENKPVPAHNLT
jgi:hypothetical protein